VEAKPSLAAMNSVDRDRLIEEKKLGFKLFFKQGISANMSMSSMHPMIGNAPDK